MRAPVASCPINRRQLVGTMVALPLLGLPGLAQAREDASRSIFFRAFRDGQPIGSHRLDFTREGETLTVDIEISFQVKILFLTVYRYHHTNRETWQNGRLVAIETRTDDNGDRFRVTGKAEGDRFVVDGSSGRLSLPADIVPSSYWDETMATGGQWLDTQAGKLARSAVKPLPPEGVKVGERTVKAKRYALVGDITCDLWYHDGAWVKLLFIGEDGSAIDYVRTTPSA